MGHDRIVSNVAAEMCLRCYPNSLGVRRGCVGRQERGGVGRDRAASRIVQTRIMESTVKAETG